MSELETAKQRMQADLYTQHVKWAKQTARAMAPNNPQAAEIGLDALTDAVMSFDPTANIKFKTFATKAIKNDLINATEAKETHSQYFVSANDIDVAAPEKEDPDYYAPNKRKFNDMLALLVNIDERRIVAMHYGPDRLSLERIAPLLGLTRWAVEMRHETALANLREKLGRGSHVSHDSSQSVGAAC